MKISKKLAAISSAALLITVGGGYVAMADIPNSSTGEITGCRVTGDAGNVRIIDKEAGKSCNSYESEVSWPSEPGLSTHHIETVGVNSSVANVVINQEVTCPSTAPDVVSGGWYVTDASVNSNTMRGNYPRQDRVGDRDTWQFVMNFQVASVPSGGVDVTLYAVCVG